MEEGGGGGAQKRREEKEPPRVEAQELGERRGTERQVERDEFRRRQAARGGHGAVSHAMKASTQDGLYF